MGNKLYVGNLPYSFRDNDLQQAFSEFGNVSSAKVMMERDTGRSKGFGFVEMGSDAEAQAAIQGLHGQNHGGRDLVVNEARPMAPALPQRRLRRRQLRWWWRFRRWPSQQLLNSPRFYASTSKRKKEPSGSFFV
jgi:RNA recognition motif-containing protein